MSPRSHPHVHDRARDPVLPRGLAAQGTVWGRALRNEMWGVIDPEWTAGDGAVGKEDQLRAPEVRYATTG